MSTQFKHSSQNQEANRTNLNGPSEEGVKIDGLQQVIEMLKYADPAFRESLLKRLTHRDPELARNLRKIIR